MEHGGARRRPSASAPTSLIRRLRDRFAPGGLLHYGQGKWYPGEPLPRWSFSLFWRRDGVPIWREPGLIAREAATPDAGRATMRSGSPKRVAERLGIMADYVQPVFEDPADRMLKEGALPENVDPDRSEDRRSAGARPHPARCSTAS